MREVGVDGLFAAPELEILLDDLTISSLCEKRLLDVELDLSNSVITFEAVQWAICELERMELQERYSIPGSHLDEGVVDARASLARSSSKELRGASGGTIPESSPSRYDEGSVDPVATIASGNRSMPESLDEKPVNRIDVDASPSRHRHQIEEPAKGDVRNWRHIFKATSKRKSGEDDSGRERGKKAKVSEFPLIAANEAVFEADDGEAGKRIAERISARLAVPECVFLTNLVSHCLLVSMDQVPTRSIQETLASSSVDRAGAAESIIGTGSKTVPDDQVARGNSTDSTDWLWLHKWLVKAVLSDAGDDDRFVSLDWLIAFMTAARQSLIKPILDDLASDLQKREAAGSVTLASYMRRTGVLEYAAFREPERIFGSLRPLFPPTVFPAPEIEGDEAQRQGINEIWHGWLGLMVLCPRLFSAFSRFWIPTLSVEDVQSWRMKSLTSLSAIWTPLVVADIEEPKTTREFLLAAILKRLAELAPVAVHFVILLSELDEATTNQGANKYILNFGNYVLTSIYKDLSKDLLPKVLGGGRDVSAEVVPGLERLKEGGTISVFMANLKQHAHVLWEKALEHYLTSKCTCCEIPHKEETQLESSGRIKGGHDSSIFVEGSGERSSGKTNHDEGPEVQKGCLYKDPLIRLCHLTLLCCPDQVVADLLASVSSVQPSSTFEQQPLRRLVMVMRTMWIVSGQGRGTLILELWAQQMIDRTLAGTDNQALQRILAVRHLLDLDFWQKYHTLLGSSSSQLASAIPMGVSEDASGHQGLSWKVVWKGVHKVMGIQWMQILPLMHREGAWELRLAVLRVLQLLNQDRYTRPQAVADRLKGVLGLFFSWLEVYDSCDDKVVAGHLGKTSSTLKPRWKWHCARAKEHLKTIIIELASSSFPSFTLMINSLLDFSFEHRRETFSAPLVPSLTGHLSRTELSAIPLRRAGAGGSSSFCMAPLSTGKLDRYGRLELIAGSAFERENLVGSLRVADSQLTEENYRIQSVGASSPLQPYEKDRLGSKLKLTVGPNAGAISTSEQLDEDLMRSKVLDAELASLLHRTFQRAIAKSVELLDEWPWHPGNVLATHMADRLETPHEVPMTMEQYEEILPKHISSLRHIFLTDSFNHNPLLMEMVELIVRHGGKRAVLRCVEFVRVLLADSIARWHGAFRTRWSQQRVSQTKVGEVEAWNRIQVSRLIQLVASANWLPQPLAASGEIVAVIDGADVADLLLLVWRCMHHAMAFGPKAWGESSSNLQVTAVPLEGQAISTTGSGVDEDAAKDGTYSEWESHFFAILRRNISKIGAHFPQVYPIRKAF